MIYFVFFLLGMMALGIIIPIVMAIIKHAKTKQAIMPSTHVKRKISDLEVGETVTVNSHCIKVDKNNRCWIDVSDSIEGDWHSGGTVDVTRTSTGYEAKLLTLTKFKSDDLMFSWCLPLEKLEIAS